ncbi:MAG: hypothetical protein V7632_3290 [Bradyrhizobium sp.]
MARTRNCIGAREMRAPLCQPVVDDGRGDPADRGNSGAPARARNWRSLASAPECWPAAPSPSPPSRSQPLHSPRRSSSAPRCVIDFGLSVTNDTWKRESSAREVEEVRNQDSAQSLAASVVGAGCRGNTAHRPPPRSGSARSPFRKTAGSPRGQKTSSTTWLARVMRNPGSWFVVGRLMRTFWFALAGTHIAKNPRRIKPRGRRQRLPITSCHGSGRAARRPAHLYRFVSNAPQGNRTASPPGYG